MSGRACYSCVPARFCGGDRKADLVKNNGFALNGRGKGLRRNKQIAPRLLMRRSRKTRSRMGHLGTVEIKELNREVFARQDTVAILETNRPVLSYGFCT